MSKHYVTYFDLLKRLGKDVSFEELWEHLYDDAYELQLVREDGRKLEYDKLLIRNEDEFNVFINEGYLFCWRSKDDAFAFEFDLYLHFHDKLEDVKITGMEVFNKADNSAYELQVIRNHDGAKLNVQKADIIHADQIYAFIREGYTLRWQPENEPMAFEFHLDKWPNPDGSWSDCWPDTDESCPE